MQTPNVIVYDQCGNSGFYGVTMLAVAKLQFVSEVEVGCSSVNVELAEADAMRTTV
jgi:hypothetical protein